MNGKVCPIYFLKTTHMQATRNAGTVGTGSHAVQKSHMQFMLQQKKVLSQPAFSQYAYICMQAQPTCSFVLACIQSICIHRHAGSACMQFCTSLHSVSLHSSASRLSLHLASGHRSACRPSLHAVLS